MIFAKALCVVLLLYSASFGDSRCLKNDTDSEKRTVHFPPATQVEQNANDLLLKNVNKPRAEAYRGFLLFLLRKIWRPTGFCKGPFLIIQNEIRSINIQAFTSKGLYFFFMPPSSVDMRNIDNTNRQDGIYPLYVGITGVSFRDRFVNHGYQNGVLKKLGDVGISRIVAYVVEMPLPVAKFYESLFLSLFDFAMNKVENGEKRPPHGVTNTMAETAENGYVYFKQKYDNMMKNVFDKLAKYTSINIEVAKKIMQAMQNYNFT